MPLDEQVGIWEMFHRVPGVTAQDSTERINASMGLGLHICKRLIELHHGQVGVESAVGRGSTFWFALPLASDLALSLGRRAMASVLSPPTPCSQGAVSYGVAWKAATPRAR